MFPTNRPLQDLTVYDVTISGAREVGNVSTSNLSIGCFFDKGQAEALARTLREHGVECEEKSFRAQRFTDDDTFYVMGEHMSAPFASLGDLRGQTYLAFYKDTFSAEQLKAFAALGFSLEDESLAGRIIAPVAEIETETLRAIFTKTSKVKWEATPRDEMGIEDNFRQVKPEWSYFADVDGQRVIVSCGTYREGIPDYGAFACYSIEIVNDEQQLLRSTYIDRRVEGGGTNLVQDIFEAANVTTLPERFELPYPADLCADFHLVPSKVVCASTSWYSPNNSPGNQHGEFDNLTKGKEYHVNSANGDHIYLHDDAGREWSFPMYCFEAIQVRHSETARPPLPRKWSLKIGD